jgi:hypothetical protein
MTLKLVMAYLKDIDKRFNERLDKLTVAELAKGSYTTAELAEQVGKAKFTVREWCRLG